METKFSKGDWYSKDGQIYPQETGKTLAIIPYFDKDNEEQQANAKLMASAPLLLKALNKILFEASDNEDKDEDDLKSQMKAIKMFAERAIYGATE